MSDKGSFANNLSDKGSFANSRSDKGSFANSLSDKGSIANSLSDKGSFANSLSDKGSFANSLSTGARTIPFRSFGVCCAFFMRYLVEYVARFHAVVSMSRCCSLFAVVFRHIRLYSCTIENTLLIEGNFQT
jgi:hypothetical protein